MGYGAKFVLEADDRASKTINNVGTAFEELTQTVKGELASKIKVLFSAAAIEEATRRTGEWAQKIDQTSKSLGISAEMLQTLQLLAEKTNTPEDAVIGMFTNIAKARQEAINGNKELQRSFQIMGMGMDKVMDKSLSTQDFVSQTISKMPEISKTMNGVQREAVESITGTPIGTMQGIQGGLSGTTLSNQNDTNKTEENVTSNQDIADLSKAMSDIMSSLKQTFSQLSPLAIFLLNLFKDLVDALGGIITVIKNIWGVVSGIFLGLSTGDWSKLFNASDILGKVTTGIVGGLMKIFTGLFSILTGIISGLYRIAANILEKIHLTGTAKKFRYAADAIDNAGKGTDTFVDSLIDKKNKYVRQGAAIGNVATIALTGGESGLGKLGAMAFKEAGGVAAKVGLEGTAGLAKKGFEHFNSVGNGERGLFGGKSIADRITDRLMKGKNEAGLNRIIDMKENSAGVFEALHNSEKGIRQNIETAFGAGGIASVVRSTTSGTKGTPNETFGPTIGLHAISTLGTQGGQTSGIRLGGVFGSNFQSRLVVLNQKMVELLTQIKVNTTVTKSQEVSNQASSYYGGGY